MAKIDSPYDQQLPYGLVEIGDDTNITAIELHQEAADDDALEDFTIMTELMVWEA